jgi:hypothetical protein
MNFIRQQLKPLVEHDAVATSLLFLLCQQDALFLNRDITHNNASMIIFDRACDSLTTSPIILAIKLLSTDKSQSLPCTFQ